MGIIAANTLPYPACSTQSKLLLADLEHRQAMMCKSIGGTSKPKVCVCGISSISIRILPAEVDLCKCC